MDEYQRLIQRLEFLKKSQVITISLDVAWLLKMLTETPRPRKISVLEIHNRVDLDGGGFRDESP